MRWYGAVKEARWAAEISREPRVSYEPGRAECSTLHSAVVCSCGEAVACTLRADAKVTI